MLYARQTDLYAAKSDGTEVHKLVIARELMKHRPTKSALAAE